MTSTDTTAQRNLLDRLIAYVSPRAAFRRERARAASAALSAISARFEGAKTGTGLANWRATSASSNVEIAADLVTLRNRSSDLIRNSGIAKNAAVIWRTLVVGCGVTPTWADDALEGAWKRWSRTCWADGMKSWGAGLGLAAFSEFERGEVYLRRRWRQRGDGIWPPFQVQVLESDYLDHTINRATENGGYILDGIEFNQFGRRVAYWMFPQHPGDQLLLGSKGFSLTARPIPAEDIIHHYEPTRAGQVHGVPRLHAAMKTIRQLEQCDETELLARAAQACIALIIQSPDADGIDKWMPRVTDQEGNPVSEMWPGMVLKTKPGETAMVNQPGFPSGYGEYKITRHRDIAAAIGMTFELLSGNYSTGNYSNSRMGAVNMQAVIESHQWNHFIPQVCDGIARWFLDAMNTFDGRTSADLPEWSPTPFRLLDRLNEAQADQLELQIGKKTWPQLCRENGTAPDDQLAAIELFSQLLHTAGVDFFGSRPSETTGGKDEKPA